MLAGLLGVTANPQDDAGQSTSIGRLGAATSFDYANMRIKDLNFYSGALTPAERTAVYNSGNATDVTALSIPGHLAEYRCNNEDTNDVLNDTSTTGININNGQLYNFTLPTDYKTFP